MWYRIKSLFVKTEPVITIFEDRLDKYGASRI